MALSQKPSQPFAWCDRPRQGALFLYPAATGSRTREPHKASGNPFECTQNAPHRTRNPASSPTPFHQTTDEWVQSPEQAAVENPVKELFRLCILASMKLLNGAETTEG